jgi:rhamnogalacturonyl hydrolase YesR
MIMFSKKESTTLICLPFFFLFIISCNNPEKQQSILPAPANEYIAEMKFDSIQSLQPEISTQEISDGILHVQVNYIIKDSINQDDWKMTITPSFNPSFHWAPLLTPNDSNIIARHVFRSPALIMADGKKQLIIVPDLDLINKNTDIKWYMDMDAVHNKMTLGISDAQVGPHVLYARKKGQRIPPGTFEFGFYIFTSNDTASLTDPWRKPLAFLWNKWGKPLYEKGEPIKDSLSPYVKHAYNWAFNTWKKNVWQEFNINGKEVGAPVFIVNVTQSPNYPGQVNEREFRSIWNQAWFNSMRSATGLYRYAKKTNDTALLRKALMTKELALSFPQKNGLFNSVIATPMETIKIKGEELNRSKGWQHYYFGNSDRNPSVDWGGADKSPLHILDMSWTAYLMLTWYEELEKDERLIQYCSNYANRLIMLQDKDGFFPAWLDSKTEKPLSVLDQSPETSMSVTFLLKLGEITKKKTYTDAALKALDAVNKKIVPIGQWEDFETYWSCSRILDSMVDKKITRNNQFKQNTLSMFWTAEAMFNAYKITGDKKYLVSGQRVLDEMLMYQASWQPKFIAIHALGGFGVMNGDGEWNDSRQSLFAELIIRYGKELNNEEYVQRGISALKASFVMMYCPENPATKEQWEKVYPFFNEKDYGFMMENYGHNGETDNKGLGIGEFTIYDWGNGAAAEAYNRIRDHYNDLIR